MAGKQELGTLAKVLDSLNTRDKLVVAAVVLPLVGLLCYASYWFGTWRMDTELSAMKSHYEGEIAELKKASQMTPSENTPEANTIADVEVTHVLTDQWNDIGRCKECHGAKHTGGTVGFWNNQYEFRIKPPKPTRISRASVHIFRVKLSRWAWSLYPDRELSDISVPQFVKTTAIQSVQCYTAYPGPYVPSLDKSTVYLLDLKDKPHAQPDIQLGSIAVPNDTPISLTFALDPRQQDEASRIGYALVEAVVVVQFHPEDNSSPMTTEPLLVSIPVHSRPTATANPEQPTPAPAPKKFYER